MNILTKRLLSALLALCMVLSTAVVLLSGTALVTYADDSTEEEDGEEEEDEGFKASDLITTEYATAEDKLRTMSKQTEVGKDKYGEPVYEYEPWKVYGNYELYVQELTGEVAIKDTSTGQILFTNPYDACTSVKKKLGVYDDSLLNQLFSQLKVTYEEVKGSCTAIMMRRLTTRSRFLTSKTVWQWNTPSVVQRTGGWFRCTWKSTVLRSTF